MLPTNPSCGSKERSVGAPVSRLRSCVAEQVAAVHRAELEGCRHPRAWIVGGGDERLRPVDAPRADVDRGDPAVSRRDDAGIGDHRHGDVRRLGGHGRRSNHGGRVGVHHVTGPSTVPYTRRPSAVKRTAPARSVALCGAWDEVPVTCRTRPVSASMSRSAPVSSIAAIRSPSWSIVMDESGKSSSIVGRIRAPVVRSATDSRIPTSVSASSQMRSAFATRAPLPLTAGPYRLSIRTLFRQIDRVHERTGLDVVDRDLVNAHGDRAPRPRDERAGHAVDALEMRRREEAVRAVIAPERGARTRVVGPRGGLPRRAGPRHPGPSPRATAPCS